MPQRLPPVESLRVLAACVRHASFTRAAAEVGVTAAAVSLRIRNLEAELGVTLFHRRGPRLEPTPAALALAGGVAEALQRMRAAVDDCRAGVRPLRLTVVPSFAARWLVPRLPHYHELSQALPIHIDVSTEMRAADEFDLAIRTGSGDWPSFDVTSFMPVEATPMLSPALAATVQLRSPADLARLPLLPHADWLRWFGEAGVAAPRIRWYPDEYPTHELDAASAVAGCGVALLSPRLFGALLRDRTLLQPFAHTLRGPGWHHLLMKREALRPALQMFRSWLRAEAAT